MILKELMLSNADIKIIFADFIEPNTNVFTQQLLKELTSEGGPSIGQQFLGVLKIVGYKQVNLLTKHYLSNLNVTLLEVAQKSKDWVILCNLQQFLASLSGEFAELIKPSQLLLRANESNEIPVIVCPFLDHKREDADEVLIKILQ